MTHTDTIPNVPMTKSQLREQNEILAGQVERYRELLRACSDDLRAEIDDRYGGTQNHYPDQMRRYQRDISIVTEVRDVLCEGK